MGNDHSFSYACPLENRNFNTNFTFRPTIGTRLFTLYSERTVAHTCQYDIILYYSIYVLHITLTSHINGMT